MLMRASAIFVAAMLVALPASAASVLNEPPDAPYEKMSTLFKFPQLRSRSRHTLCRPKDTAGRPVPRL